MLIPVRPAADGEPATWAIVELQGEIERREGNSTAEPFDVGTICMSADGVLQLTIGYHQLDGKRQALKKPMAVLSKVAAREGDDAPLAYEVIAVVREKYLFNSRPRALITKREVKG